MKCFQFVLSVYAGFCAGGGQLTAAAVSGYSIAPITPEMQDATAAIFSNLLPESGVTQESSVGWQRLAYICDTFGPRFSGSQSLEDALDYIRDTATADGLNVTEQFTMVPRWVRGDEWAYLLSPRKKKLHMVGLGMSNSSQGKNITADVLVVSGYDELHAGDNCSKAEGKIVLFNTIFTTYGATVSSRTNAAVWAQECNAVGALIRTIAPFSMQNPHTGYSITGNIPAAAVSLEDASQLKRMQDRGQKVVVSMYMESVLMPDSQSRNLLIDLVGYEKPHEYVLVSGHGDSWDTAEGSMDDGGGFMVSWEAVRVMKQLGLRPRRTIRAVVWVNEENGDAGGLQYAEDGARDNILLNHSIAIETDGGIFTPWGFGVSCKNESNGGCGLAMAQLETLSPLLDPLSGGGNIKSGGGGADIDPMCQDSGIVCAGWEVLDPRLEANPSATNNPCTIDANGAWAAPEYDPTTQTSYNSGYFWFHHSDADTMERIDPTQFNENAAALAVWTFAIAELPEMLPRNNPAPVTASSNDDEVKKFWDYTEVHIGAISLLVVLSTLMVYVLYVRREKEVEEELGLMNDKNPCEQDI